MGHASLVGNRDVTGGARQTGGNFPFYALYGKVRSNLPESGSRPRTRLESDCAVCVCVCSTRHLSFTFVFMVTNKMFNLLSGIWFGPIYGICISVLLRVRSQIWDLECSVTWHNCQIQIVLSRVGWRWAREGRAQRCHISQLCIVFNLILFILGFSHLNTHKH